MSQRMMSRGRGRSEPPIVDSQADPPAPDVQSSDKSVAPGGSKRKFSKNAMKKKSSYSARDQQLVRTPAATSSSVVPNMSAAVEGFNIDAKSNPRRRRVKYIPDLKGLGDVAHHVWTIFRSKKSSSSILRDYHYLTFLEETMRVAMLYMIWCTSFESLEGIWNRVEILTMCRALEGKKIPLFLHNFLYNVGTFTGSNGTGFYWALPSALDAEPLTGSLNRIYASGFPNFKIYRRALKNLLANRAWNSYPALPGAQVNEVNPQLIPAMDMRLFPGLQTTLATPSRQIVEHLANAQLEITVNDGNDALYYFQEDSLYSAYRDGVFERMFEDGLPSAEIKIPMAMPVGTEVGNYNLRVIGEDRDTWYPKYYTIYTGIAKVDQAAMHLAAIFRPTLLSNFAQYAYDEEAHDDRFDQELMQENMMTNEFDKEIGLKAFVAKVYAP